MRKNETYHDAVEKWQSLDIQVKHVAGEPHLNHNHPSSTRHKVRQNNAKYIQVEQASGAPHTSEVQDGSKVQPSGEFLSPVDF